MKSNINNNCIKNNNINDKNKNYETDLDDFCSEFVIMVMLKVELASCE